MMSDQIKTADDLCGYIDAQQELKGPLEISFDGKTYEPWGDAAKRKVDLGRMMSWRQVENITIEPAKA